MSKGRQSQLFERNEWILSTAELLLLNSENHDLTLDELAKALELAKGTLYRHFGSKDELFLQLLIRHETRLAISHEINDDASARLARWLLMALFESKKTMMFQMLEDRLVNLPLNDGFNELYQIRQERLTVLHAMAQDYLQKIPSTLSAREYLARLWAIAQGGAMLLNSSFYQRHFNRHAFMWGLVRDALDLPKLYKAPKVAQPPAPKEEDAFSPFGKLNPPTL